MKIQSHSGHFSYFYEDEYGKNPLKLVGEICFEGCYDFQPEEKEVRYNRDGSGYPGWPAQISLYELVATSVDGTRLNLEDGKIIGKWLETVFERDDFYRIHEHISEQINEQVGSF